MADKIIEISYQSWGKLIRALLSVIRYLERAFM